MILSFKKYFYFEISISKTLYIYYNNNDYFYNDASEDIILYLKFTLIGYLKI